MPVSEDAMILSYDANEFKICPIMNNFCVKAQCMMWIEITQWVDGKSKKLGGRCGLVGNVRKFPESGL